MLVLHNLLRIIMHVLSFFVLGKASIYMFNNYNLINFSLLKRGVVHVILK